MCIGKRSDPFFADAESVLHWLAAGEPGIFDWTVADTFADAKHLLDRLGSHPTTYSAVGRRSEHGSRSACAATARLCQMDREGNPSFNPILNPDDIKDEFNATDPVDDVKNHLQPLSETLQQHGYPPDEAKGAAQTLLPDILHYDRTRPVHYPNGRVITDDVFSARMIFMVHGQATPQGIEPHDDLMAFSRSSARRILRCRAIRRAELLVTRHAARSIKRDGTSYDSST